MKYCWSVQESHGNMIAPGVILLGAMCIAKMIGRVSVQTSDLKLVAIETTIFIILFSIPTVWAYISARQYQIDATGITIRYPFGLVRKHNWYDFSEIALCKIHYAAGGTAHTLAIRCAIGNERFGPTQATASKEWWSTMGYEVIHFNRIISIYYTAERYAEFLDNCPHPIKDYRRLKDLN